MTKFKSKFGPKVTVQNYKPAPRTIPARHPTKLEEPPMPESITKLGQEAKAAALVSQQGPITPEPEEKQAEDQLIKERAENPAAWMGKPPLPGSIVNLPIYAPYREPRWLTSTEVAKHLHVSIKRLARHRTNKDGPRFYQLKDGLVLYNVHDVDAWVMSHGTEDMEISL
jgi:hypothetical protein